MPQPKRQTRLAPADPQAISAAAACLRAGGLVAMPTETVYGLAADATNDRAVAAIYVAKGRPAFNPLIAHVAGAAAAAREGAFDDFARRLAEAFWPGPLTIVAPVAPGCQVSLLARAGLETLALRAPDHPTAQALIAAAGVPLAAPSANRSGRLSPTTAAHVAADLGGRIDWILDGGPARSGVESTIVACLGGRPRLLRPGALTRERIEAVLVPSDRPVQNSRRVSLRVISFTERTSATSNSSPLAAFTLARYSHIKRHSGNVSLSVLLGSSHSTGGNCPWPTIRLSQVLLLRRYFGGVWIDWLG